MENTATSRYTPYKMLFTQNRAFKIFYRSTRTSFYTAGTVPGITINTHETTKLSMDKHVLIHRRIKSSHNSAFCICLCHDRREELSNQEQAYYGHGAENLSK